MGSALWMNFLLQPLLALPLVACGSEKGADAANLSNTDTTGGPDAGATDTNGNLDSNVADGANVAASDDAEGLSEAGAEAPGASSSTAECEGAECSSVSPVPTETEEPILVNDSDAGPLHCERELSFEAVTLDEPEPFDVVIVADHSDSISWSKDDLASGLSSLLDEVYGYDARFFVLTPTQYGASSASALDWATGEDLVLWKDPVSGQVYDHEVTRYSQVCTDGNGKERVCPNYPNQYEAYSIDGRFDFVMPDPIAAITRDMSGKELALQKQTLTDAILNLGGHASQVEQPMCTLSRYIKQPRAQLPEHAVFVVISDEDDASSPSDCVESYHYAWGPYEGQGEVGGCTEQCDLWRSLVWRPVVSARIEFQCAAVDDLGVVYPERGHSDWDSAGSVDSCAEIDSTCSDANLVRAAERCGAGYVVQGCVRSCNANGGPVGCSVDLQDESIDGCVEPFEYDGEQYANVVDYCEQHTGSQGWGDCEREGLTLEQASSWTTSYGLSRVVPAAVDVVDMIRDFQVKAINTFGEDGFYVATIAFDTSFDCTPGTGQSYAQFLRLISKGPKDVFPICEPYAPVLSSVTGFAKKLLPTDYAISLGANESIESVSVTGRDGETRQLQAEQFSYDAAAMNLHIDASALHANDVTLNVTLVDPCARRVH